MECGLNDVCDFVRGSKVSDRSTLSYPSMEIVEGHVAYESNKSWKEPKSLSLYLEKNHQDSCQTRNIPTELGINETYVFIMLSLRYEEVLKTVILP